MNKYNLGHWILLIMFFVIIFTPFKSSAVSQDESGNSFVAFSHKITTLEEAKDLQTVLNRLLSPSPNLTVDGIMGSKSIKAIKLFQKLKGLQDDGVVGPLTRFHLEDSQKNNHNNVNSSSNENTHNDSNSSSDSDKKDTNNLTECGYGTIYSHRTGKLCKGAIELDLPVGCTPYTNYSSITGLSCKKITECKTGYQLTGNACVPTTCTGSSTDSCSIMNGTGVQVRSCTNGTWSSFGTCNVSSCNNGYQISGNTCVANTVPTTTPTLSVDYLNTFTASAGSNDYFNVTSNIPWTVSSYPSWLILSKTSGSGNDQVTATAIANTGAQRTGTITLTGQGVSPASLNVLQLAGAAVVVPSGKPIKIYIIGASTTSDYTSASYPLAGWGMKMPQFFNNQNVTIINNAVQGESSKSYSASTKWTNTKNALSQGDYLFIQFAHNDELSDPVYHTDPYTTYKSYQQIYVDAARAKGAYPVLLTPIERNSWSGTKIIPSHGDYPAALRQLAQEQNVPMIDLTTKTTTLFELFGKQETTYNLFMNFAGGVYPNYPNGSSDSIHLQEKGALEVAKLVVAGIQELGNGAYTSALLPYIIGSTTPALPSGDTTSPTISSVSATGITSSGAVVNWTTNEASDSQVEYGPTTSYGSTTTLNTTKLTNHSVSLSALTANTTYHYRVKSKDASGNIATGSDNTFKTLVVNSTTVPGITNPPAISQFPKGATQLEEQLLKMYPPFAKYDRLNTWFQAATFSPTQSQSTTARITIDYMRFIAQRSDGTETIIFEENYNQAASYLASGGLWKRSPVWYPDDVHESLDSSNSVIKDGTLIMDISKRPDKIFHWWTPQVSVNTTDKYMIEVSLKIEGDLGLQLGGDWWDSKSSGWNGYDCTCATSSNCEAWVSRWFGDTGGKFITIRAPRGDGVKKNACTGDSY